MTQRDSFLNFFQFNNGILTLGQILNTNFSAEYRRIITELRQQGHKIIVKLNRKNPGMNTYYLDKDMGEANRRCESPVAKSSPTNFNKSGQGEMNFIGELRYD